MKKLTVASLALLSTSAFASSSVVGSIADIEPQQEESFLSGVHGVVGLGVVNSTTYAGVDNDETNVVPLINVSYNDTVYFQFNKIGAWLFKPAKTGFRLGLVAQPKKGYDKGDGPLVDRELDDTALVGLRAKYRQKQFSLDATFYGSTEEDSGSEVHISANYLIYASQQGTLSGFAKVVGLSEDAVDYAYYGSGEFEGAESSTTSTIGLFATYNVAPKWSVMGSVSGTFYGNEIKDAPGVTQDNDTKAFIGLAYKF